MFTGKNLPLWIIGVIVLIIGVVVVSLAINNGPDLIKPPPSTVQDLGQAPDFTIEVLGAGTKSLKDYRGKPLVVNFWASWCGPCREETPDLVKTSNKYSDRVNFLGIIFQDDESAARQFIKDFGVRYENALDPNGAAARAYKITGIPTTLVIDAKGVLRARWLGVIPPKTLTSYIDGALES